MNNIREYQMNPPQWNQDYLMVYSSPDYTSPFHSPLAQMSYEYGPPLDMPIEENKEREEHSMEERKCKCVGMGIVIFLLLLILSILLWHQVGEQVLKQEKEKLVSSYSLMLTIANMKGLLQDKGSKTKSVTTASISEKKSERKIDEDVLWLARIIHAEASNQPFEGKVAVANVVLNRVKSPDFPDTVYDVIFEKGQFSPVQNKTIYSDPTEEDIKAAEAALKGETLVEDALFFENPKIAKNKWIRKTREFVKQIGDHRFYR